MKSAVDIKSLSKTDGSRLARLREKAPKENQELDKATIHWQEIDSVIVPGKNRPYTKVVVPVTCRVGRAGCFGKRPVMVLHGMSGSELLTPECLTAKGYTFNGVCWNCYKHERPPIQYLPNKAEIHWEDVNEEGTLVKCAPPEYGGCGRFARRHSLRDLKNYTGLCRSCGVRRATGSKTIREGPDKGKVRFNCENCGKLSAAPYSTRRYKNWSKLCEECRTDRSPSNSPRGKPRTIVVPYEFGPLKARVIRLEGNHALVICPYPSCQEPEHWMRFGATRGKVGEQNYGYCPSHNLSSRANRADIVALLQSKAQNGNEQKNGSGKKRPGPGPKITDDKLREAFKFLGGFAPQEKVAEHIGVEARSIRDYQKARGINYSQLRQQFTSTGSN